MNFKIFSLIFCLFCCMPHISNGSATEEFKESERQMLASAQGSFEPIIDSETFKQAISFPIDRLDQDQRAAFIGITGKSILLENDRLFLKKNYLEAYITYEYTNGDIGQPDLVGCFLSGTTDKAPCLTEKDRTTPLDSLLAEPGSISKNPQNKLEKARLEEDFKTKGLILDSTQFQQKIEKIWENARQFSSSDSLKHGLRGLSYLASVEQNDEAQKTKKDFLKSLHYSCRENAFSKLFYQENKQDSKNKGKWIGGSLKDIYSHTETWALASIALKNQKVVETTISKRQRIDLDEEAQIRLKKVNLNLYSRIEACPNCRINLESACTHEKAFFLKKILRKDELLMLGGQQKKDKKIEEKKGEESLSYFSASLNKEKYKDIEFAINFYSLYNEDGEPHPKTTKFPLPKEKKK